MLEPKTREQWQEAVNLADMWQTLGCAREYGLIQGGPMINEMRCEQLIERGAKQGVHPNWSTEQMADAMRQITEGMTEALSSMTELAEEIKGLRDVNEDLAEDVASASSALRGEG